MAIDLGIPDSTSIKLCHGDLKPRHLLKSNEKVFTIDTEQSVFAVGSLDLGVWASKRIIYGESSFDVIKSIRNIAQTEEEINTAIQWLVYSIAFGYLVRTQHGDLEEPTKKLMRVLYDLSLAM